MKTTCHICGQTDDTDIAQWGNNADLGWYHFACARQQREQIEEMLSRWDGLKTSAYWRLEAERIRFLVSEKPEVAK